MNAKLFRLPLTLLTLLALSSVSTRSQAVITFDDLVDKGGGTLITNAYQGLSWSNFAVVNAILLSNFLGYAEGYNYGMVSASNVALNAGGNPAVIDALGTNFSFLNAYLTGAWNSNLNIEVQGFRGGALLYDTTVIASATNSTLFTFNYTDIDRLYFNSFGGEPAFGDPSREAFVMDNFSFEFVPEPSSLLLTAGGVLTLWAFVRRKRASP